MHNELLEDAQLAFAQEDYAQTFELATTVMNAFPGKLEARILRVNAGLKLSRWQEVIPDLNALIQSFPQNQQFRRLLALCWLRTGNALRDKGEVKSAEASYKQAIKANPYSPDARYNLGLLWLADKQFAQAVNMLQAVLTVEPNNTTVMLHLARGFIGAQREFESVALLKRIANKLSDPLEIEQCAELFIDCGEITIALSMAQNYLEGDPKRWNWGWKCAMSLRLNGYISQAKALLELLYSNSTTPDERFRTDLARSLSLPVVYQTTAHLIESRTIYDTELRGFCQRWSVEKLAEQKLTPSSFMWENFLLAYQGCDDRILQEIYGDWLCTSMNVFGSELPALSRSSGRPRPRLVLLSSFFRESTVSAYFSSWIEHLSHQGEAWEIILVQLGPVYDEWTERLGQVVTQLIKLDAPLLDMAQIIRELQADMVLFPEIGMDARTLALAAMRLASIQICAWGHPITSGLPTIDAYFSCVEMEPENAHDYYSEPLLLLPGLGTRYLSPAIPIAFTRKELKFAENENLYLIPQSPFKLHPDNDEVLMKILLQDAHALFIFFEGSNHGSTWLLKQRVLQVLAKVSSNPESHIRFFPQCSRNDYLRVNGVCDVMIDSLHWSGGNTTLDALHCGLPVITCPGKFMRGRQSMAMLRRLDCEEVIAETPQQLANIAVELAKNKIRREQISAKIRANLPNLTDSHESLHVLTSHLRTLIDIKKSDLN